MKELEGKLYGRTRENCYELPVGLQKQNKFLNLDEMRSILEQNIPYEKDVRKLLLYEPSLYS
ncbi:MULTISPECIES: hypothetical protein [Lactococcus]|uniref:hypothetical protein n=1 Tax=Lactococcus TaxID=1357 RepID=UPI001E406816|nr:hypothetical protein [Lactococcus cremoris]